MATINEIVSYIYTNEASLEAVPVKYGQLIISSDSEKLYIDKDRRISLGDLVIVETSDALPIAPLDKLYFTKDTNTLYINSNGTWVSINPNQFIDPNRLLPDTANNGEILQYYINTGELATPTNLNNASQADGDDVVITYNNFSSSSYSKWYAIFDGVADSSVLYSSYILPCWIQWQYKNGGKLINKLRIYSHSRNSGSGYTAHFAPSTFTFSGSNNGSAWTQLLSVEGYGWPGDNGYNHTESTIYHDWFFENTEAYTYYKLEVTAAISGGITSNSDVRFRELEGYAEVREWRRVPFSELLADVTIDLSNYQQDSSISLTSTSGSISLSGTDLLLNGNASNTAGGIPVIGENGKLPNTLLDMPDVDLSNHVENNTIKLTSTAGAVDLISNTMEVALYSGTAHVKANVDSVELQGTNLKFNNNAQNTAGGIVVVDKESGKVPSSLLPTSSAISVVVSDTEPENPTEGMIWIQP